MNQGSFRSALISACIFSLGPAIISIPLKFSKIGLFIGWIILLIAAFINYMTMTFIITLSDKYKINSYSSLVRKILGKNWAKFVDALIVVNNLGVLTLYLVISKFS